MEIHRRDALGRLVQRQGGHSRTHYCYGLAGELEEVRREPTAEGLALGLQADAIRFVHDATGWLLAEHGAHGSVQYERDALGNVQTVTLPDGQRVDTLYYGSGHAHQVQFNGAVIADFERDALHREIVRTQGRLHTCTGYTSLGQTAWQRVSHQRPPPGDDAPAEAHSAQWWRHQYDSRGERLESVERRQGRTTYGYDAAGQLILRSAENFDVERFAWDAAGNLVDDANVPPGVKPPPLLDNLLRRYHGVQYEYDDWGQLTQRDGLQLGWDDEGHLLWTEDSQQRTDYRYDALGRRIAKTVQPKTPGRPYGRPEAKPQETHFVWQGLRLAQQIDVGQARKRTWLYDPARAYAPLACVDQTPGDRKGQVYHYHTDPTGTPREVTDENGKLVWQASYSAWGRVRANLVLNNGREFEQPLRLPGQYHDAESGLHYNTFRYYDAHCGKFISSDPIGLAGGLNLYAYAPNPFSWIDPWGLAGNPATATHITYQGFDIATGKPYVGYASMQGNQLGQDVLNYRYGGDFGRFGDEAPQILYRGYGQEGKDVARGLEQRTFENLGGLDGTANKQNPVGLGNGRRTDYLNAADEHLGKSSGSAGSNASC